MKRSTYRRIRWSVVAWAVGFLVVPQIGAATVYYVSTAGNDANDGLSWPAAKLTVQAGLNAAASGDQVWVAAGTYVQCITLRDGVALYGGFAGGETDLAQRDWKADPAILDGNKAGSVVTAPSGATQTTGIDGFTIRNGKGTTVAVDGTNRLCGGGVYCDRASPAITNNRITANGAYYGGGIYCTNYSGPTIASNKIAGNTATHGAGIYCTTSSSLAITNNDIAGNSATGSYYGYGGGICCDSYSRPTIANNLIRANSAYGVYCLSSSSPAITNDTIIGNHGDGIVYSSCSPTVANTIVAFNFSGITTGYDTAVASLRYNCVYGNPRGNYVGSSDPTGTNGNISADPQLADMGYGNAHIQPGSPCVSAGDDSIVQAGWVDMDGQARILGARVDIGADESDGTVWPTGPNVVVRVSPTGDDVNDGSSWLLAKRTVQAGIDAASAARGEVWVQEGTYPQRVTLRDYAHVFGGFAGTELQRSARSFARHVTVLDGGQGGSVVTASQLGYATSTLDGFTIRNDSGTSWGSSYCGGGIYCNYASPTLANNTIVTNAAYYGGGICCLASLPRILNSVVVANTSSSVGGIYCYYSSPLITNSTIAGNSGTGVRADSASFPTVANTVVAYNSSGVSGSSFSLRYNCVYGNFAANYTGMTDPTGTDGNISVDPKLAQPFCVNVHIQPDSPCVDAGDDSAVQADWLDMDAQPRIAGTRVDIGADESDGTAWPSQPAAVVRVSPSGDDNNDGSSWPLAKRTVQAGTNAAAICRGGQVWVAAGTYLENITLSLDTAVYGGFGGSETDLSQRNWIANPTILDGNQKTSVITVNAGLTQASRIEGLTIRNGSRESGGGIYCSSSSPTIINNTITGNEASPFSLASYSRGGGIYCSQSSATIVNNIITANGAYNSGIGAGGLGGGIYCAGGSPVIANNTIVGNVSSAGGGIGWAASSPTIVNTVVAFNSSGMYGSGASTPVLRSNCVYGNTAYGYSGLADPTGTDGNMAADPKFAGVAYGNIHIQPDSPCVDVGNDSAVQAGSTDFEGQPRTAGAHVDIGADECNGTAWPAGPYAVVRVSPGGNDANDGSSWSAAKRTVQGAIDAALAVGGEVWVQAGAYPERILLRPFVHVYGGFAGTETQRSSRDWAHNAAVLDGGQGGSVVTASSIAAGFCTLDGLTIRNGRAACGGGILCYYASPGISNCTVAENSAPQGGGGIFCWNSSPVIDSNTINANSVSGAPGGGICCAYGSPTIERNTISSNIAGQPGGGIACFYGSAIVRGNTIRGNSAPSGGGIYCDADASATISDNVVENNSAIGGSTSSGIRAGAGGGIYCGARSSVQIAGNTITANSAVGYGGGVYCDTSCSGTICSNTFTGNSVTEYSGAGGGVYCYSCSPTIANNVFAAGRARDGSGLYLYSSSPLVTGNTIVGNSENRPYSRSGGIFCYSGSPLIANTIIAFNSSGFSKSGSALPVLRYNCVFGNTAYNYSGLTDPTGTNGNISADPRFVSASPGPDGIWGTSDDDYGDLRLLAGSPCIDAGGNADVPADTADLDGDGDTTEPLPVDLGGYPRFLDDPATPDCRWAPGTCGTPPIVDMGAYEFAADTDGDGVPDFQDDCPDSDLGQTIVINGLDTGVPNQPLGDGCTMADEIAKLAAGAGNHGAFVSGVAQLTNDWVAAGRITEAQKGRIQSAAGRSRIPGDINGDGFVDASDLLILAGSFGKFAGDSAPDAACDLNLDGAVDVSDLLILAGNWGA